MMKKTIISFIAVAFATSLSAQIELKSEGKKVEKLTCGMDNVDLRVYLPKEVKNYEVLEVHLSRHTDEEMVKFTYDSQIRGETNVFFRNIYNTQEFKSWEYIDFKLIDGEKSDMRIGTIIYSLEEVCNYSLRDFERTYNKISIVGGTHSGWKGTGDYARKTYDYSEIKSYSFVHEIGSANENYFNPSGEIGMKKIKLEDLNINLYEDDNSMFCNFRSTSSGPESSESVFNGIYIKMKTLDGYSISDLKESVERGIISTSNYYWNTSSYEDESLFNFMMNRKLIYEGAIAGGGDSKGGGFGKKLLNAYGMNSSDKQKEEVLKMMESPGDYFEWKKDTYNGVEYEVLDIPIYDKNQTDLDNSKRTVILDEEKGKSKLYKVLITEKNGTVYIAAIAQTGTPKLTEDSKKLIQNFENTIMIKTK